MDRIETKSTSAKTAECTPIVLRDTGRVRLLFRPTLVANEKVPKACIKGDFVYQRKGANETWESQNALSLGTIKTGEQYKLELHSAELLTLVEALGPLFRTQWEAGGIQFGRREYVRLEGSAARLLGLGREDLERLLDAHPADAVLMLGKLLRWLSAGSNPQAAEQLTNIEPESLPAITAMLGLSALKSALSEWAANESNASEPFWQATLAKYSFALSQLFAHPVVVIQERAYLGGKAIDDSGGSYLDFLAAATSTGGVVLIEIKTPATPLLGAEYRGGGAYPPSGELAGAVAQVQKYRHTFATDFAALASRSGRELIPGGVPCLIVAGNATRDLDTPQKRQAFEAYRNELATVRIVTYDELFAKLRTSVELLENGRAGAA